MITTELQRLADALERANRIIAAAQGIGLDATDEQTEVDTLAETLLVKAGC